MTKIEMNASKSVTYKCLRCRKRVTIEKDQPVAPCEECGCKIFYKERPMVRKKITEIE